MRAKLPFCGRIFWVILPIVVVLVIIAWVIAVKGFGYEMGAQDYVGSAISLVIFSYLVHLWMLPDEYWPLRDDEEGAGSRSDESDGAGRENDHAS